MADVAAGGLSQSFSPGGRGTGCTPDEVAAPPGCAPAGMGTRTGKGRRTKKTPRRLIQSDSAGSLLSGRPQLAVGGEEEGLAGNAMQVGEEGDGGLEELPLGKWGVDGGRGHAVPAGAVALVEAAGTRRQRRGWA